MFITSAYAQTANEAAQAAPTSAMIVSYLPLFIILIVFYFLVIRPQSKKAREHNAMLQTLRKGDTVMTTGGFIVEIQTVHEDQTIEVSFSDGTAAKLSTQAVVSVMEKSVDKKAITAAKKK